MRNQKRDANEGAIIAALKGKACSVEQLPGGNGRPDLLVYDPRSGWSFLMEVKMPGKNLNDLQQKWHAAWGGFVPVVHSVEEALATLYGYRRL
jgi:hypothetical protein